MARKQDCSHARAKPAETTGRNVWPPHGDGSVVLPSSAVEGSFVVESVAWLRSPLGALGWRCCRVVSHDYSVCWLAAFKEHVVTLFVWKSLLPCWTHRLTTEVRARFFLVVCVRLGSPSHGSCAMPYTRGRKRECVCV